MKFQAFLIKYGEIGIKGKNKYLFEDALIRQMRYALKEVDGTFAIRKSQGRVYIECEGEYDYEGTVESLKRVFGIVGICPVVHVTNTTFEELTSDVVNYVKELYPEGNKTFKVRAMRERKTYPKTSMEMNCELGGMILDHVPNMRVDVHHPDIMLHVEVRELVYIYSEIIPGAGGMPVGTNGNAMLLLSGGIDSPVAGYMIAKRGVGLEATYFHAPPYTSERAKQKVIDLAKLVSRYSGPVKLHVVNFTEIQLYIYDQCPHDELTIIMRRYMMKIAEHLAKESGCLGLITGESIGQVASQTMQSLAATNEVCTMPVYRPLIGFDKQEIIDIAQKIDTYETSIQPFEDCCTIFVAKHPVTKPNLTFIKKSEENLKEKIEELFETAIQTTETIHIK
ncbi:MAG: tRNA uracil 4-sulfurtransferase ThiI [Lachnospiraceae bacterium]